MTRRRSALSGFALSLAALLVLPFGALSPAQAVEPEPDPVVVVAAESAPAEPTAAEPTAGAPEASESAAETEPVLPDEPTAGSPAEPEPQEEPVVPAEVGGSAGTSAGAAEFGLLDSSSQVRPIALTSGHIDLFEVTYDSAIEGLRLSVKDDTTLYSSSVAFRDPTTVGLYIDSALATMDVSGLATHPQLNFLTVGGTVSTIYMLPQVQDHNLPWPGWSTERLANTLPPTLELPASGSPVTLDVAVDGPGEVFAWQTSTFGGVGQKFIDTVAGLAQIPISRNAHVHTNWAFTNPGTYELTVTPSATTSAGGTIAGPGVVYRIHVGPATDAAPQAATVPSIAGTGTVDEALTISWGEWLPNPHRTTVQWLRDGELIPGATSAAYVPTSDDAGTSITARVTARVGTATSEHVTAAVAIEGEPPVELLPTSFQAFTATPASPRIGQNITLTATVNPRGGTAAAPQGVGGIVEFYRGEGEDAVKLGQSTITSLTLSRASFVLPAADLGAQVFTARYLPPSTHAESVSNPATVTVVPASTSVVAAASLGEVAVGQPVTLSGSVTPSAAAGTIRILSGGDVLAEGEVAQGRFQATVSDLPAGSYMLRAEFTSADPSYNSSVSLPTIDVPLSVVQGAPRGTWGRTVVDHEHVDVFSVTLDGDQLKLGTRIDLDSKSKTPLPKFGSNRERIDPASAVFVLPDKVSTGLGQPGGRKVIPNNPNYAFLGDPGDPVWVAPASSDLTPFLYAGFESESIARGQLQGDRIEVHLVGVDAPAGGRFETFTGGLTPTGEPWRLLSSTDPEFSSALHAVATHDHFNWAFTKLGTYVLHVKATATLADGTQVETAVQSYTWVVGDLAGAPQLSLAPQAGVEGEAELVATVAPAAAGQVEFFDADGVLLGFATVADGVAKLPVALPAGTHQLTARFLPSLLDEHLPAQAGPTAVEVAPDADGVVPLRPYTLTRGHMDLLEVTYDAEREGLRMRTKDDTNLYGTGVTFLDPESLSVFVDTALTKWTIPTTGWTVGLYDFIGEPGTTIYRLPQNQNPVLPWPGWSTERLRASMPADLQLASGAAVELAVEASGPGDVFTWMLDVEGEPVNRYIDTKDPAPDVIPVHIPAHVHTLWGFTQPGDYLLKVTPTANLADGSTLTGEPGVYHFRVGEVAEVTPQNQAAPTVTGSGELGGPLAAELGDWLPNPHSVAVQWLRDGEPITGATGVAYTPTADDLGQPISVQVTAVVGGQSATARSAAVTGVDITAPRVSAQARQRTLTVVATDSGSGVDRIELSVDGGAWQQYTSPVDLPGTAGHRVEFRAVDLAGNVSVTGSISIAALAPQGPLAGEAIGAARTVLAGEAVFGYGVRLTDGSGQAAQGVPLSFAVTGGTFAGGGTTASAVSNAAGIAVAPAVQTSAPGTVVITASFPDGELALPPVEVVAPASSAAQVHAVSSVVAGKVVIEVTATNDSGEPVKAVLKTKYGSKTFAEVAPGATVSHTFKTYLGSIAAGVASATLTGSDGVTVIETSYAAA